MKWLEFGASLPTMQGIFFFFFHLTYSRWTSSLPSCLWSQRIFPSLPGSRLTIFLSRCKFSTLTTRQPMVEFSCSLIPGRGCFCAIPGDGIVVSPPPLIVETLEHRQHTPLRCTYCRIPSEMGSKCFLSHTHLSVATSCFALPRPGDDGFRRQLCGGLRQLWV